MATEAEGVSKYFRIIHVIGCNAKKYQPLSNQRMRLKPMNITNVGEVLRLGFLSGRMISKG